MEWINADQPPEDDVTIWVTNNKLPMLPMKAYYDKNLDIFFLLESHALLPLQVTHWMKIPSQPKEL